MPETMIEIVRRKRIEAGLMVRVSNLKSSPDGHSLEYGAKDKASLANFIERARRNSPNAIIEIISGERG